VKVALRALVLCLAGLLLAAPDSILAADEPYEINVVAALTGPGSFVGLATQDTLGALERNVNKQGGINGQPVRFVFHDDQTNPQVSVQLVNQLIAKNVPVILGPTITATCRAAVPLVANGPILYCITPGVVPAKDGYVFSANISTHDGMIKMFQFFHQRGWKRIATLTSIDATGQDADEQLNDVASHPENKDITFVLREHFNNTDVSLAAQMARIKAIKPQVLIGWATGPPIGAVFQGILQAGLDLPVFTSGSNETYAQMKQYASLLPKDLYFTSPIYPTGEIVRKQRAALHVFYDTVKGMGIKPDLQTGFAWDPALIIIDALRHTGVHGTAEQVHTYIENLHDFPGISGVYDFRDGSNRGVGVAGEVITRWDPAANIWTVVQR
jgi:branched-chain amino acid transport system substrate-binding protein